MANVSGKDINGNSTVISVTSKDGKVQIFSPENSGSIALTKEEALELIKEIKRAILADNLA